MVILAALPLAASAMRYPPYCFFQRSFGVCKANERLADDLATWCVEAIPVGAGIKKSHK
jgi:hypothetical protein